MLMGDGCPVLTGGACSLAHPTHVGSASRVLRQLRADSQNERMSPTVGGTWKRVSLMA